MAVAGQKTIRVIAEAQSAALNRVNVVTRQPVKNEYPTFVQATGPSGNIYPTVQLAPTGTVGVKTIYVAGFSAVG